MNYIPNTAKAEFHLTYKCNLSCVACSRASWLKRPHTGDMTLDDAREFFRQADEIRWKDKPRQYEERPRIIFMGGEPTLHPDFLEMVRICSEWSENYVQVYSNGNTPAIRERLEKARLIHSASIAYNSFKIKSVRVIEDYDTANWCLDTFVSPADAGVPSPLCYVHSAQMCGLSVDHDGYAMCPIGGTMRALQGLPRTKNLADLFDADTAAKMTVDECRHCGYEYPKRHRLLASEDVSKFAAYASAQPITEQGCRMSSTWRAIFDGRIPKADK